MRFARACRFPLGRKLRRLLTIQKILSIPYTTTAPFAASCTRYRGARNKADIDGHKSARGVKKAVKVEYDEHALTGGKARDG
jgi:hypothetical protein